MQTDEIIKCKTTTTTNTFIMEIVYYESDIVYSSYLYVFTVKTPFIPYLNKHENKIQINEEYGHRKEYMISIYPNIINIQVMVLLGPKNP